MDEFDDIFRGKTTDAFKYKSQLLNTEASIADNLDIVDDGAGARSVLALCPSSTSKSYIMLNYNGYIILPSNDSNSRWLSLIDVNQI